MSQTYLSPLCSCIICHEVKSAKGIHTHYLVSHTEKGKSKHYEATNNFKDKRKINQKTALKKIKDTRIQNYNLNKKQCEFCKTYFEYDNRHLKFCNNSCSAKFNMNQRKINEWKLSDESKQKTSNSVKKFIKINGKIGGKSSLSTPSKISVQCNNNDIYLHSRITWCKICGLAKHKNSPNHKSQWCNINKSSTTRLLAATFNIKLGLSDTLSNMNNSFNMLKQSYEIELLSGVEIHKKYEFKCSTSHILNILKTIGINRRTLSKATSLALLTGRSNPKSDAKYKSGIHYSWDSIEHYYRSSYELEFYKILDQKQWIYETETLRLQYFDSSENKTRICIPDIIIQNKKLIFEIKSDYTYDYQNMKDKFDSYKQHGYRPYLILEGKLYWMLPAQVKEFTIKNKIAKC